MDSTPDRGPDPAHSVPVVPGAAGAAHAVHPFANDRGFFGHPRGLSTLFFTEMWERFSFYGMRALLILFMTASVSVGGLGFSVAEAGIVYGLYTAFVYLTALPGGWIADRLIGQRRAVFIGGVIIMLGHIALMFTGMAAFYGGLVLVVLGTGLLKPNISTIVGELYPEDQPARRDAGFSIFYMGINIGAFVAPIVCGFLAQDDGFRAWLLERGMDPNHSWHWGFGAAAVGMGLGLIQYLVTDKFLGEAGKAPTGSSTPEDFSNAQSLAVKGGIGILALLGIATALHLADLVSIATFGSALVLLLPVVYFTYLFSRDEWSPVERKRLYVIGLLFVASALFWSAFEQAGSTLNLFAERFTATSVLGFDFPASWLQSVNSLWIMSLAGVFAWLWVWLSKRNKEPSSPMKFALGLIFVGGGFAILAVAAMVSGEEGALVSPLWLVTVYLFHTIGELCLSPVGLSTVTKLAPHRAVAQMMGVWFMSVALGNFLGGQVATLFEAMNLPTIFWSVFAISAVAGLILAFFSKPIQKLMGGVH